MIWYLTLVIVINANYAKYLKTLTGPIALFFPVSFLFYVTVGLGSVFMLSQACEW